MIICFYIEKMILLCLGLIDRFIYDLVKLFKGNKFWKINGCIVLNVMKYKLN